MNSDLLELGNVIRRIEKNKIDMLHFDVMDGVFVNNISYGIPILSAIRKATDLVLDVHLMITEPHRYVKAFAEAGADIICFHAEAESDIKGTVQDIRSRGIRAALAVKPATPVESIFEYLPYVDMVLVMTVEPGFGGQSFIPETVEKIRAVREYSEKLGIDMNIQVDGGINSETAAICRNAGANVLVSGSFLFNSKDMAACAKEMKGEI